jgi:hypothetical protein
VIARAGVAVLTVLAFPAAANAGSRDVTSTARFLTAESRVEHTVIARRGMVKAAADALIEDVESACPSAVPASLETGSNAQRHTWTAFVNEASYELAVAELSPIRTAVGLELARIAPLRWTSAKLNRRVASYVRGGRRALALHPPDLCQQARAAARLGFTVIPPQTQAFDERFQSTQTEPSALDLAQQMKPLATPGELTAIESLDHLQARVDRLLTGFATQAFEQLTRALTGVSVPGV